MTITIRLKTDNAAFSDDNGDDGQRLDEVERILREWLRSGVRDARLRDYNGNTVGSVTVTGK